jgi:hypothetical protein
VTIPFYRSAISPVYLKVARIFITLRFSVSHNVIPFQCRIPPTNVKISTESYLRVCSESPHNPYLLQVAENSQMVSVHHRFGYAPQHIAQEPTALSSDSIPILDFYNSSLLGVAVNLRIIAYLCLHTLLCISSPSPQEPKFLSTSLVACTGS